MQEDKLPPIELARNTLRREIKKQKLLIGEMEKSLEQLELLNEKLEDAL